MLFGLSGTLSGEFTIGIGVPNMSFVFGAGGAPRRRGGELELESIVNDYLLYGSLEYLSINFQRDTAAGRFESRVNCTLGINEGQRIFAT